MESVVVVLDMIVVGNASLSNDMFHHMSQFLGFLLGFGSIMETLDPDHWYYDSWFVFVFVDVFVCFVEDVE